VKFHFCLMHGSAVVVGWRARQEEEEKLIKMMTLIGMTPVFFFERKRKGFVSLFSSVSEFAC